MGQKKGKRKKKRNCTKWEEDIDVGLALPLDLSGVDIPVLYDV